MLLGTHDFQFGAAFVRPQTGGQCMGLSIEGGTGHRGRVFLQL